MNEAQDPELVPDPEIPLLSSPENHPGWFVFICALFTLQCVIANQVKKIGELESVIAKQRDEIAKVKLYRYTNSILTCDKDVAFFTGLANRSVFDKLHSLIVPFVKRRWTGVSRLCKNVRNLKKTIIPLRPTEEIDITWGVFDDTDEIKTRFIE